MLTETLELWAAMALCVCYTLTLFVRFWGVYPPSGKLTPSGSQSSSGRTWRQSDTTSWWPTIQWFTYRMIRPGIHWECQTKHIIKWKGWIVFPSTRIHGTLTRYHNNDVFTRITWIKQLSTYHLTRKWTFFHPRSFTSLRGIATDTILGSVYKIHGVFANGPRILHAGTPENTENSERDGWKPLKASRTTDLLRDFPVM